MLKKTITVLTAIISLAMPVSCASEEKPLRMYTMRNSTVKAQLMDKYRLYVSLLAQQQRYHGDSGWLTKDCDGLLYNSLAAAAGIPGINIEAAKDATGQWFRTPSKNCYPDVSPSTISRDMFWGLSYWIFVNYRADIINEIIDYGRKRQNQIGSWVMGQGDITRITIRANMQATLYWLRYRLTGIDNRQKYLPQYWTTSTKGYATHLEFLHMFMYGLTTGAIDERGYRVMAEHLRRQPQNALFAAIMSRFGANTIDQALSTLFNERLFPKDRLPTNNNYCTDYIFARDYAAHDWLPCQQHEDYVRGIDFIFASAILLNII